jgi:hypothetical protein
MEQGDSKKLFGLIGFVIVALLFISASALAGYVYVLYQNEKEIVADRDKEVDQYTSRLRSTRYSQRAENVNPVAVNTADNTITVQNDSGDNVELTITSTSSIQEVGLTADKKTKKWTDATLSQVLTTSKVSILYNGLDEVISLVFTNEDI